jgi:hypothetical protein
VAACTPRERKWIDTFEVTPTIFTKRTWILITLLLSTVFRRGNRMNCVGMAIDERSARLLGSGHSPQLPNGARQWETIFIDAPTSFMERLIKCDADPACLPPDDVTVVIAALDVDDKIEWTGNADLAFDFKIRAANWNLADQAVDPWAVERDCSRHYDILALGAAIVFHQTPLMPKRSKFP